MKFFLLAEENKNTYAWLTDYLHGIIWEAGVTITHSFSISSTGSNSGFETVPFFTKGTEKCTFLRNFFFSVVDLDILGCPKASQFSYISTRVCPNHQRSYKLNHRAREKVLEKNNLQLTLSSNLYLSVTTTSGVTRDADVRIKLVKDEFKQVGSHKLLRKGVIQLTASEYSQL